MSTSAALVSIQAVSPVSILGASAARMVGTSPATARIMTDLRNDGGLARTYSSLQRVFVSIAGADSDDGFDRVDEDLPVAHYARARRFDDRVDGLVFFLGFHADAEQNLGDEPDVHLHAAVPLGVPGLPAVASHFARGDAKDPNLRQRG